MITNDELKEIMNSTKAIKSKKRNKYIKQIKPWLKRKEIVIIKGIRRCGKTHIMYQLIKDLPKRNTFYFNFDDFRLDKYLEINLLEKIINLRDKTEPSYFFLDEIQRIKGFEKWLRTYYDREENIKFIIGGSNISLLSPKLSTVLTGRNITFEIYPLDFTEFKEFSSDSIDIFLEFGGFPEIVLMKEDIQKRRLLEQYVNDIISKDIISKYDLNNITQLKALINFFLNNPGVKISANKLGKQLGIHKDTAQKYIEYIKDTFLIFEVPFFSYSAKIKYIGTYAPKYYCIDNGIHSITTTRKNRGSLLENAVAIKLKQDSEDLFYWQGNNEIDFVTNKCAIQVTADNKIPKREVIAFEDFKKTNNKIKKYLLINPNKNKIDKKIKFVKIMDFL